MELKTLNLVHAQLAPLKEDPVAHRFEVFQVHFNSTVIFFVIQHSKLKYIAENSTIRTVKRFSMI